MKKYILMIIVLTFTLSLFAEIIYVPDDYPTIQLAVNAASPGDEICVYNGIYNQNISINTHSIILRSFSGPGDCIISGYEHCITVNLPMEKIEGFTLKNASNSALVIQGGLSELKNCIFEDNEKSGMPLIGGSAITAWESFDELSGCIFRNNTGPHTVVISSDYPLGYNPTVNETIKKNIFVNNTNTAAYPINGKDISIMNASSNYHGIIDNNTFNGNSGGIYIVGALNGNADLNIRNSIFYNAGITDDTFYPENVTISYSCFSSIGYQGTYTWGDGNLIFTNPCIDDECSLIWNTTIISPCIDTGDPASPCDPDGTRADIGAVRAIDHNSHTTTAQPTRCRYRSFPVLDRIYNEGFETTYVCEPVETQTNYFRIFDQWNNEKEWFFDPQSWLGDLNTLDSVEGYKIKTASDVDIPTLGITLPEDTRVYLDAGRNWVGYFIEESMGISEAFAEIWDHLTGIYSEDWAWNSNNIPHARSTLLYGKMYIVSVDEACSFVYGQGTPVPHREREMTEGFYYVETPTYSPINIENLDDPTVLELGVFLDGECIGATQMEEFPLQILAFPAEGGRGSGEVTFEFYCEGRSYKTAQDYKVLNKKTGQYDNSQIELRPYEFTTICFGNPPTPAKFTLSGNYPNPFNPTTTISYSIPTDGNVELTIYNIRGQKVKTLISGTQPTGVYNVTWNGKDENDRSVSSGVYFYKLKTNGKELTRKMLMLK